MEGIEVTAAIPRFDIVDFQGWYSAYLDNRALFDEPVYTEKPAQPYEVPGEPKCGNPIGVSTGVKVQEDTDFETAGDPMLSLTRRYSTAGNRAAKGLFGEHWSSNVEHVITRTNCAASMAVGNTSCGSGHQYLTVYTDSGAPYTYYLSIQANIYVHPDDAFSTVTANPDQTYTLKRADDSEIKFRSDGRVEYILDSFGNRWNYSYTSNQITIARAGSTRSMVLNISPSRQMVTSVIEPGGQTYIYDYAAADRLASVDYPGSAADSRQYSYTSNALGYLEGIDVGGIRFATFTYYDSPSDWRYGRGKTSQHADGVEKTKFEYDVQYIGGKMAPYTVVTNALDLKTTYWFGGSNQRRKLIGMDRAATSDCPFAAKSATYDSNGHLDLETAFDGVVTDYDYNFDGQLRKKVEGITAMTPLGRRYVKYDWDAKNRLVVTTTGELDLAAGGVERDISRSTTVFASATTATQTAYGDVRNRIKSITAASLLGSGVSRAQSYTYLIYSTNPATAIKSIREDGPIPGTNDRVTFDYSASGDLQSVKNALNHTTSLELYNGRGQPQRITDVNGDMVGRLYDSRGRLASETHDYGGGDQVSTFDYDRFGNVAKFKEPGAPEVWFTYDDANRLVTRQEGASTDTATSWSSTDLRFVYNKLSIATKVAKGRTTYTPAPMQCSGSFCWPIGFPKTCVSETTIQHRTIDAIGRVRATSSAVINGNNGGSSHQCFSYTSAPGPITQFAYDDVGRLASVTQPSGAQRTYSYDSLGRLSTEVDEAHHTTQYSYGFIQSPGGFERSYSVTPAAGGSTTHFYDGLGLLLGVDSPDSTQNVRHLYYPDGRQWVRTDPDGITATHAYDGIGRVTSITYAKPPSVARGQGLTDRLSALTSNVQSRPIAGGTTLRPANVDSYEYDCKSAIGRLCATIRGRAMPWRTSYTYGAYGAVASITEEPDQSDGSWTTQVDFTRDQYGRLSTVSYPSGNQISYLYANGSLTGITANIAGVVRQVVGQIYTTPSGRVNRLTFGNGLVYDAHATTYMDDRVEKITTSGAGLTPQDLELTYDSTARVSHIANAVRPQATQGFGYDSKSQLTSSQRSGISDAWTHDAIGNHETHQRSTTLWDLQYAGTRLQAISKSGYQRSYGYNEHGNVEYYLDGASTVLAYHYAQHLYFVFRPYANTGCNPSTGLCTTYPGATWEYGTNAARQRVYKAELGHNPGADCTPNGFSENCLPENIEPHWLRQYAYDINGQLLHENYRPANSAGGYAPATSRTDYVWLQGKPIAMMRDSELLFISNDHLGRPEIVTNDSKQIVWSANNFAFHREVINSSIGDFNLALPGQYWDAETGMHYNWNRFYDDSTGRYIQRDPLGLGGGLNTYTYASSNPLSRIDPFGLKDYTICETQAVLDEARADVTRYIMPIRYFVMARNHRAGGKFDFKIMQPNDTFRVPGRQLSAAAFGNYIAGYSGVYMYPGGYWDVRAAGILFDYIDGAHDWDRDSVPDIDAGADRASAEMAGKMSTDPCECNS